MGPFSHSLNPHYPLSFSVDRIVARASIRVKINDSVQAIRFHPVFFTEKSPDLPHADTTWAQGPDKPPIQSPGERLFNPPNRGVGELWRVRTGSSTCNVCARSAWLEAAVVGLIILSFKLRTLTNMHENRWDGCGLQHQYWPT
jgi:hypothetical protein